MSDEQQQSLREYSYEVIAFPNAVPPVPHNQATMPREHPAPDISQDSIFMPPVTVAPAAHLAYPHRMGYAPHYGPIPPWDGATHVHHQTPHAPQFNDNIAPAQPCGAVTATASRPPFSDMSLNIAENTPDPPRRRPKRSRQDFDDGCYNPTVPGTSMANIYRNLATRFINDPRSNITAMRMESSAGHSKVVFELEIPNDA
ncbi:hypothetical protein BJV77DRAFT_600369 [Russula vinacea]|nr:hypothetical protein BJV77DRAFT_600369 [Russula vinacea]